MASTPTINLWDRPRPPLMASAISIAWGSAFGPTRVSLVESCAWFPSFSPGNCDPSANHPRRLRGFPKMSRHSQWKPPNNSLQLTRLACGKLERDLPAKLRENEWPVARAAGQLSSRPLGAKSPPPMRADRNARREGSLVKALVIYDSVFGNTERIAQAIANALGPQVDVEVLQANRVSPEQLTELDLLVVGSPTRGFRPTEAVAGLLKRIRPKALKDAKVAAFDTRFKADELDSAGLRFVVKTGGYAAKRIAAQLKKAGGSLIVPPEGFYVEDTEGPLKASELERAAGWAKSILDAH